jgi:aminocarboxymuconate-semialdehyde decarboxylase
MTDPTDPQAWADAWGPTAAAQPEVRAVDVHSHLMVPAAAKAAQPHFRPELDPRTFYSSPETTALNQAFYAAAAPKYSDPRARLEDMDALGIDVQMLAISPLQYFYWADEPLAVEIARIQNDRIAEVVAHAPDRFAGVGTLPLAHPRAAAAEVHRLADDVGFRAVQIGAEAHGTELDDPALTPVWEALEATGTTAILHPSGFTHGERLTDYYLVNVIGMPLSSTLAVTRMILGGVFERHQALRMLVVHGGGYLPFYAARTDHAFRHRPELRHHIDRLPSEYLTRLHFDITVFDPGMIAQLVRDYGADRVLLGTDYPFDMGLTDPLAMLEAAGLSDEDHRAVAGGNAAALFGV